MAVMLTERAAEEVKKFMEAQNYSPADNALRIAVAGGGCSGYSYKLDIDESYNAETDKRFEYFGVGLVVDKKSELLLDGTTIDYLDGIDKRGFKIENPNAVKTCGCGSSFQA